jgi:hypothetical protein
MVGSSPAAGPQRRPDALPASSAGGLGAAGSSGPIGSSRPPSLVEAIDRLAADIQHLRVDFERFFSGVLPFPPDELRNRVQAQLRSLRNVNGGTAVDRFRMGDLEARYNAYNELFNRRLREREEGGRGRSRPAPAAPPVRYDPAAGIVIGRTLDPEAVAALYQGLVGAPASGSSVDSTGNSPSTGASPRFDLATFGVYLERQAAAIRDKTGCEDVQFRLATEDGKVKLKARPLGAGKALARGS